MKTYKYDLHDDSIRVLHSHHGFTLALDEALERRLEYLRLCATRLEKTDVRVVDATGEDYWVDAIPKEVSDA
jgi:hypothetical protein